jgi:hypothetical protein
LTQCSVDDPLRCRTEERLRQWGRLREQRPRPIRQGKPGVGARKDVGGGNDVKERDALDCVRVASAIRYATRPPLS